MVATNIREDKIHKIECILSVLGLGFSKRDIKEIFLLNDADFDNLVEKTNGSNEMSCINGMYFFSPSEKTESIIIEDFIEPIYYYLNIYSKELNTYKEIIERISNAVLEAKQEYLFLSLSIGEYAEQKRNIDLAITIYKYTAILSNELDIVQRKRILVKSVLRLSKLEFMRGISPEETLNLQRAAINLITQSNLTSEDALLMIYAGMGEHFAGSMEEGEILRSKGIKYMKQFDYDSLEAEAVPLIGWHYYLEGDFRKTVAYYESFILEIENRVDGDIITFAYPPIIFSYFFLGEASRALALAEMIYKHVLRDKDKLAANLLKAIIGRTYIYLEKQDIAEKILDEAYREGEEIGYGWGMYYALMGTCYLEELRGDYIGCRNALIKAREIAVKEHFAPIIASPFILDALKGIKDNKITPIGDFTYDNELKKYLDGKNIHLKGIAFRHVAQIKIKEGKEIEKIIDDLKSSVYFLEMSGNVNELSKAHICLAKLYYKHGDYSQAEMAAVRAIHLNKDADKQLPKQLSISTASVNEQRDLKIELETTWLELRDIVTEERQQTRLLSSMCRTFSAESGAFVIISGSNTELKLVQNIDRGNKTGAEMQRISEAIQQSIKSKKVVIYDCKREEGGAEAEKTSKHLWEGPLFYLAIPFIRKKQVEAVLYLQSYWPDKRIMEGEEKYIEEFAQKMSGPLFSVMDLNQLNLVSVPTEDSFSQGERAQKEICMSEDDEVNFILEQIRKVAKTNIPVLITGETGVGKEVFAREVFKYSDYRKTFIKVNCGAIPESLIESELFGYEKGSFTGATQRKKGYFELAEGGTLFLDEIGELSLISQVKLLRILQEQELMRVGGTETIKVNFRLIAATNKDLREEVMKNRFRKDLYYRLNVVQLSIPPLRRRKKDIPIFAEFFLKKYCEQLGKPVCQIDNDSLLNMIEYSWPGNVREMENVLQKAVLFGEGESIKVELGSYQNDFENIFESQNIIKDNETLQVLDSQERMLSLADMERHYITMVISHCGGKLSGKGGAAEILGLKRTTLISKMQKLGMRKPNDKEVNN